MRHATLLVLSLLPGLGGCVHEYCTLEMKYAHVAVVDASGAPYAVDAVTYAVDGVERLCLGSGSSWSCGLETSGDYAFRVLEGDEVTAEEIVPVGQPGNVCIESMDLEIVI